MPRTTETAIRQILDTQLTSAQIVAFLTDANLWVTEEVASFTPAISAARLELIERYLACALIRTRELGVASYGAASVSENYQADPQVSDYLLRAAALDPSGKVRDTFLAAKPSRDMFHGIARVVPGFAEDEPAL